MCVSWGWDVGEGNTDFHAASRRKPLRGEEEPPGGGGAGGGGGRGGRGEGREEVEVRQSRDLCLRCER